MVVFPDTMYTFRDTQGGMIKTDSFFSYLTFVTASSWSKYCIHWSRGGGGWGGGGKGPESPGKTQVIWDFRGNKQLDLPPPPRKVVLSLEKMLKPLWNLGKLYKPLAFCKISGGLLKRTKNRCQWFFKTDGPGPPPPLYPLTKIPGSAHVLIQILSYCCFIYAGMPYNNCWGLFLKRIALMTGCILYQLKVLSVKLWGVISVILFGHFWGRIWESFPIQKWPLFSQFHVF